MASILSHPAVPLGIALALGRTIVSTRLLVAAGVCSILPDGDVLGMQAGIDYGHVFGHRGFTHSLVFAALVGAAGALWAERLHATRPVAWLVLFLATASHGMLDGMTNGGLGVAYFSPFSNERIFLPWQVIQVSPIGIGAFFSSWGVKVLISEAWFVWLPCLGFGLAGLLVRKSLRRIREPPQAS